MNSWRLLFSYLNFYYSTNFHQIFCKCGFLLPCEWGIWIPSLILQSSLRNTRLILKFFGNRIKVKENLRYLTILLQIDVLIPRRFNAYWLESIWWFPREFLCVLKLQMLPDGSRESAKASHITLVIWNHTASQDQKTFIKGLIANRGGCHTIG